jgi:hypothetical protein
MTTTTCLSRGRHDAEHRARGADGMTPTTCPWYDEHSTREGDGLMTSTVTMPARKRVPR